MSGPLSILRRWTFLLPLAIGLVWTTLCGYDGLTGADSNDYSWNATRWDHWLAGGPRPPFEEHPPGFPIAGAVLGKVLGDPRVAMRLLPMLAFVLSIALLRRILKKQNVANSGMLPAYLLLAFGASPFLLRYALVVLSDLPGLALMLAFYAVLLKAWRTRRPRWYVLAAGTAAVALSIRYAALPMVMAAIAYVLYALVRPPWRIPVATAAVLLSMTGAVLVTFPPSSVSAHLGNTPLQHWSLLNIFRSIHRSDDGLLIYRLPNILYVSTIVVHPGFLPVGALLLPFFRRGDLSGFAQRLAASMLCGYLVFAAGLPFQNDRVMLVTLPFFCILLFPAFTRAWAWADPHRLRPQLLVIGCCILQLGLFARAMWPFIRQAERERDLAGRLAALHVHHVYTHGLAPVLRNRCPQMEVTDLWYGPIAHFEPGAWVLVDEPNLRDQWQGLHPWLNWCRAQEQGVERLEAGPDGWVFARVE